MNCTIFNPDRLSTRCFEPSCTAFPKQPHACNGGFWCGEHCPEHGTAMAPAERTAPVEGMAGEQMRLPV